MALTARAQKLRNQMVTTPAICVERLRYMTESYQQTEGESNLMRRAKALAYILSHMTVRINEGELFVGNFTSKIRGGAIAPELKGQWLLDELDTLSTRPFDRYQPLTDAEVETLRQYLPYWKGKSAFEYWQTMVPPAYQRLDHIMVATGGYAENGHHWAHTAADYEKLLKVGSLGIIAEAEERLSALDYTDPTAETRRQFYLAVQVVHQGLIAFAGRYAALAEQMAAEETTPARKAELERIAATCRKVPAHPAENLFEAIQSCWLLYVALMIEGWGAGPTFGRADQYLYPYYQRDRARGLITDEQVQELFSLMFIKTNGGINLQSYVVADGKGGHPTMQSLCVGGITPDGRDAVNELSYLFLSAEGDVGLGAEDMMVRINRLNPNSYVKHAMETAKKLGGKLKFVSDDTSIQSMLYLGVPLEKARDYISTGCHNPTVPHYSRNTGGGAMNAGLALELALNNGVGRVLKERLGPETGDPRAFKDFEQLLEAFETQLKAGLRLQMVNKHADFASFGRYPCVLLSSMYDPCMERGVDDYNGGTAPHITFALGMIGIPNVADALAAVKKVIFEEKQYSMEELIDALNHNFEGYEGLLHQLEKAPKFGNDDDYVDLIAKRILSDAGDYVAQFRTHYGAKFATACFAMTTNVMFGRLVGALPDGRKAGQPLSEGGISPYQGRNTSGAPATMRSVAKLDQVKLALGSILNMRIDPEAVKNDEKMDRMVALLRTFCETGGNLVQFNFASNEVLRAAQKAPEQYRDLLVRVATYSAFFVELGPETQEDIINRNELA
ncbi:glycyl radical protein [Flavonifractor sp. An306]|uniref:glycyl radical protein n=1 Tax=Flavonifractor sp. An306 TaxID=1965629 RepID=UPI00174B4D11|nr:pyruvate formate lyase family protein [Flavonifractor sp. An306]